ncbi:MAG: class I tRNA ligase family protein, partial [Verrucomicrobiota bacterium]
YRFLGRVWRLFVDEKAETEYEQASTVASGTDSSAEAARLLDLIRLSPLIRDDTPTPAQLKLLHECIRKVSQDLEHLQFNTAISAMMVFINGAMTWENRPSSVLKGFLQLLAPVAPHLAEELWDRLHRHVGATAPSLTYAPWPAFDPALLVETEMELPVQVNGKLRDVIRMPVGASSAEIEAAALKAEKAQSFLAGKTVKKVIVVPRKMVNVVVA